VLDRFYYPFLERFPTLPALAATSREEVLKAWEGLGYYRRAGYVHEAAKACVAQGLSTLPATIEALQTLPGIGRNTAHAVACFGYGIAAPVMEANLKRVLARIFALETPTDAEWWDAAHALLDNAHSFDYNQAMMDIGATLCTPKSPTCALCPAASICAGKAEPERYPQKKAKKQVPERYVQLIVACTDEATPRYYLETRDTALLGGLWGFVQLPMAAASVMIDGHTHSISSDANAVVVKHVYSHFKLFGTVREVVVAAASATGNGWHTIEQIHQRPLSGVDRKVVAILAP
jgi:A/G-specific adenine glycosylase